MIGCAGRELLARFLGGELSPAASEDMAAHVEDCAACQGLLDQLMSEAPALPRTTWGGEADPPPEFLERLRRTLPETPPPDVLLRRGRDAIGGRLGDESGVGQGLDGVAPSPAAVPGYEILSELSRGGMGVVYRARQVGLNRLVALKMILAGARAGTRDRARFHAEAEAVARLRHPNIVQIHDIGEYDGCPYFSMELIDGPTLARACQGRPQPARVAATIVQTLARAIACAHQQGILHRDLKPANVLLQPVAAPAPLAHDGQTNRGGHATASLSTSIWTPKLIDFGLAKRLDDVSLTQHGLILGTPSYMAPEQVNGKGWAMGPAVDVYSLGAILYELLAGRPPFLAGSIESTLAIVASEDPIPPRRLRPDVPRDLETIVLKCLEKEPARRYGTADELADDLARFQSGEPVRAQAPRWWDRLIKLMWRNQAAVAGLAGIAASLLLGLAATGYLAIRETRARRHADANAAVARDSAGRADAAEAAARREAYLARLSAAQSALREHDVSQAARQLDLAPSGLRGWEWAHLRARLDDGLGPIAGGGRFKDLIGFLDDGRLAVCGSAEIQIFDRPWAEVAARLPVRADQVTRVWDASTPRETRFLIYESGNRLRLVDRAGETLRLIPLELGYESLVCAMRPGRGAVAVWSNSRSVPQAKIRRIYDLETGSSARPFGEDGFEVYGLDFDSSGTRLASACGDGTVRLWNAATGRSTATMRGHAGEVRVVAFRPDGRRLASGGADHTVRIWDPATGRLLDTRRSHQSAVVCLAYSPDGRRIASVDKDGPIRIWEPEGNESDGRSLQGHPQGVSSLAFSPDGARRLAVSPDGALLASLGTTGDVRLWDVSDAGDPRVLRGHTAQVYPVAFSPDGRWIASGGWDQRVRLWDAASGKQVAVLEQELRDDPNFVLSVAFSPDGSRLASWARFGQIRIWDTAAGQLLRILNHAGRKRSGFVHELAFSPDGTLLYAPKEDHVACWDAQTGRELPALPLPLLETRIIVFRPDGQRLAAAGKGDDLVIVDPTDGRVLVRVRHEGGPIEAIRFSPDGRRLVTGGQSGAVRLWDADDGRLLRSFEFHTREVFAVAWHPDGTRLATAGRDRIIRIWDTETGDELIGLAGHSEYVFSLAFSPDGSTLASGSGDHTVRLWDAFPVARRLQARRPM